jgi:branched-chain amino acid transport system substrate-binding protein
MPRASILTGPAIALAASLALATAARAEPQPIRVGNVVDYSGPTAAVGIPYGRGKEAAVAWINGAGGIGGRPLALDTVDAGYEVPPAIAAYKRWVDEGAVAIQGWGTADTEALVRFVSEDRIPFFSASYAAGLTDPLGRGPETRRPSPFNFIMGPSYSDGLRGLLDWAMTDWRARGAAAGGRVPRYVHMGDNHPFPTAPRRAGEDHARSLGFEVLPAIQYPMIPGDVRQQCLDLRQAGADYAYLGNTTASNIELLRTCRRMGVETQFLINIWGMDEPSIRAAGTAADGAVWVMAGGTWLENSPGMARVRELARAADPGITYQPHHYVRAVCAVFFMRDAMVAAAADGAVSGTAIRDGMYARQDWVPDGLDGACARATWSPDDHRGFARVLVYRARVTAEPAADGDLAQLIGDGTIALVPVYTIDVPRKADWLGW